MNGAVQCWASGPDRSVFGFLKWCHCAGLSEWSSTVLSLMCQTNLLFPAFLKWWHCAALSECSSTVLVFWARPINCVRLSQVMSLCCLKWMEQYGAEPYVPDQSAISRLSQVMTLCCFKWMEQYSAGLLGQTDQLCSVVLKWWHPGTVCKLSIGVMSPCDSPGFVSFSSELMKLRWLAWRTQ